MICYLCGKELQLKEELDDDHIPMRQLYAQQIRKNHNPNLLTIKTHCLCQKAYQSDEDYFVSTFAVFVSDTYSGSALWSDVKRKLQRQESQGLRERISGEFSEASPEGIYLPDGKIYKSYDTNRVNNVIWKITRGLFFKEYERFLPVDTPRKIQCVPPGEEPPKEFMHVRDTLSKATYPGVFDYKFMMIKEINNLHVWAFLFWDKLISFHYFHDPECQCKICNKVN